MSQYSKVLHFQKNGNAVNVTVKDQYGETTPQILFRKSGVADVEVFTDPEDMTATTDPLLSINDEAGTVYAELVATNDTNASDLIVSVDGTEYAAKKASSSGGGLSSDADFAFFVDSADTVTAASSNTNFATVNVVDNLVEVSLVDTTTEGNTTITITITSKRTIPGNTADNIIRTSSTFNLWITNTPGIISGTDLDKIYGFKIDKNDSNPATRVTYTDDAVGLTPTSLNSNGTLNLGSWDGRFVLNAFRPVMLNYDGTVAYELDHDDQTKKLDGTASDISNTSFGGNAMVGVARLWFYCYEDSNYEYCKVASYQVNSNYKAYAHIDANGTLKEEVFLPMFEGSYISNKMRSLAGQAPGVSQTGTTEIQYAQANGTGWYTDDWINHKLIENLGILISRSTNSQTSFGRGFVDGNSAPCTTGTLKDKGMFYGPSGGKSAVKLFYIENYYGSRWDRIAGCVTKSDYKVWVKPNPPYNTDGTGYTAFGTLVTSNGYNYINKCTMTEYGLIPIQFSGGSETTYYADAFYLSSGADYGLYGGGWNRGGLCGLSCLYLRYAVSGSSGDLGASLSYK